MHNMKIFLKDIWPIENMSEYKIHFARYNQTSQPLDVWVRDKSKWQGWQETRPGRNDFNKPNIFSLMQFYHEEDTWLFGGVFSVLARHEDRYEVELTKMGAKFIGRLKIRSPYKNRATRVRMESYYNEFEVKEILSEPYSGRTFPGFEEIDISFGELEAFIQKGRPDWSAALKSIKGVYLITDTEKDKRYVGSAYGDDGIWSRWENYIQTGHGGNVGIIQLMKDQGIDCYQEDLNIDYCRNSFRFALLERLPFNLSDSEVISREDHWKRILLTRETGLNRN